MARIVLDANGSDFFLNQEDLATLREKNRISFPLNSLDKVFGSLVLTFDYPNRITLPNGAYNAIDGFCSEEYLLRRIKKRRGTTEYRLKAHKDSFFKDVENFQKKNIELIGSRCRYDRFSVRISEL